MLQGDLDCPHLHGLTASFPTATLPGLAQDLNFFSIFLWSFKRQDQCRLFHSPLSPAISWGWRSSMWIYWHSNCSAQLEGATDKAWETTSLVLRLPNILKILRDQFSIPTYARSQGDSMVALYTQRIAWRVSNVHPAVPSEPKTQSKEGEYNAFDHQFNPIWHITNEFNLKCDCQPSLYARHNVYFVPPPAPATPSETASWNHRFWVLLLHCGE